MGTETDWVYRVCEPHGSEGWRPYGGDLERWRGTITVDDSSEGPQYALSLVIADLMTEWKVRRLHRAKHVRVYLWRDEEGDREDADVIVEVRPSIHAELPASDCPRRCAWEARTAVTARTHPTHRTLESTCLSRLTPRYQGFGWAADRSHCGGDRSSRVGRDKGTAAPAAWTAE